MRISELQALADRFGRDATLGEVLAVLHREAQERAAAQLAERLPSGLFGLPRPGPDRPTR